MEGQLDWSEVRRFLESLPELEDDRAYLIMLVVRSRYAKEIVGKTVKDTVLERRIIIGGPGWRDRAFRAIESLAFLAKNADKVYTVAGVPPPPQATGVLFRLNKSRVVPGLMDYITRLLEIGMLTKQFLLLQDADVLWFRSLHARAKKRFYTVDLESKDEDAVRVIEDALRGYGGWWMKIETPRGYHYIVDLRAVERRFFSEFPRRLEELAEMGVKAELIKDSIEPVPGVPYGNFTPRIVV